MPVEADALKLLRLVFVLAMAFAVEIDRLFRLVFVLAMPVAVDTDRLYNWLPVTASVEPEAILPSATWVIRRVSPVELLPTLTTLAAPPSELEKPKTTELAPVAVASIPSATSPVWPA